MIREDGFWRSDRSRVYLGQRGPSGETSVSVYDRMIHRDPLYADALPLRLDLANHSPSGFEWGYMGSGPAQLALALLADHYGIPDKADVTDDSRERLEHVLATYQTFKTIVQRLQAPAWCMTTATIAMVLRNMRKPHNPPFLDALARDLEDAAIDGRWWRP